MTRLLVFGATALACLGCAQAATSTADRKFVAMVSQGGMFEVKAGEAASNQGSTQDIKDQGATEAHDHALVGKALNSAASDAGITFPDTLNPMFQKQLDAAFATEAKSGSNAKLVAFAVETHRIVLRHIGEITALGPAK